MIFNSLDFFIFWISLYAIYWLLPGRYQNPILLLSSLVFYGYWDWRFLSLLLFVIAGNYVVALGFKSKPGSQVLVFVGVGLNLFVLGIFKYFDFFVSQLAAIFPYVSIENNILGSVILPMGISFYTFQSIGYIVDVYRRRIQPCESVLDFALFVSFFPQLLAGPIERANRFLPQITQVRKFKGSMVVDGILLALWGYFQKTVIADNFLGSISLVFSNPQVISTTAIYLATLASCIRLYCDFSGYSKIARGVAMTLGFELSLNFYNPFFARSPQQCWRRWHITLTTWFRDYTLRPLNFWFKNKLGLRGRFVPVLLTTALIGLWHGPSWNFILWGVAQGGIVGLAYRIQKIWRPESKVVQFLVWLVYFNAIIVSSQLFFLRSISDLSIHLLSWGSGFTFGPLEMGISLKLLFFAVPLFVIEVIHEVKGASYFFSNQGLSYRLSMAYLVFLLILLSAATGTYYYAYLQF